MSKELTKALRVVLDVAETSYCSELHHKPSQYHTGGDCPVMDEIKKSASIIREFMLSDGFPK